MNVLYFLKECTRLIRQYYEQATKPFSETIRKIEAEGEPFVPPYSEEPEPAFLAEWVKANELLEVTGRSCVSMLSASLQLYLNAWDRILGLQFKVQFKAAFKGEGLIGVATGSVLPRDWCWTGKNAPPTSPSSSKWCSHEIAINIQTASPRSA